MHTYNLQGNTILYAYLHLCFSIYIKSGFTVLWDYM